MSEQVNNVARRLACGTDSDPQRPPISPKLQRQILALRIVAKPLQLPPRLLTIERQPTGTDQRPIQPYHRRPPKIKNLSLPKICIRRN